MPKSLCSFGITFKRYAKHSAGSKAEEEEHQLDDLVG
jgi:hypothetical protein